MAALVDETFDEQKDINTPPALKGKDYIFVGVEHLQLESVVAAKVNEFLANSFQVNQENEKFDHKYKKTQEQYIISESIKAARRFLDAARAGEALTMQFIGEMGAGKTTALELVYGILEIINEHELENDKKINKITFKLSDSRGYSSRNLVMNGNTQTEISPVVEDMSGVKSILNLIKEKVDIDYELKAGDIVMISELQFLTEKSDDLDELLKYCAKKGLSVLIDSLHSNFQGIVFERTEYLINKVGREDVVEFWPCNMPRPDAATELNMRTVTLNLYGEFTEYDWDPLTANYLNNMPKYKRAEIVRDVLHAVQIGLLPEMFLNYVEDENGKRKIVGVRIVSGFNDAVYVPGGHERYSATDFETVLNFWKQIGDTEQYSLYDEQRLERQRRRSA